jgi:hypothetical protein
VAWVLAISRIAGSILTTSRTSIVKTGFACGAEYFASVVGAFATENPKTRHSFQIGGMGFSSNESAGAFVEEGETGPQNRPRWFNIFLIDAGTGCKIARVPGASHDYSRTTRPDYIAAGLVRW